MFSNLSASSISLATVTPSLVMRGAPNALSSTTLRPLGPSVTFTASARMSTPRSMRWRASAENLTSLAAIVVLVLSLNAVVANSAPWRCGTRSLVGRLGGFLLLGGLAFDHAHHVAFLHDEQRFSVDLDLGARPLAEQDPVADLQVDRDELAAFVAAAGADGDDLAFLRLFLRGVRNDDAARSLALALDATNNDA